VKGFGKAKGRKQFFFEKKNRRTFANRISLYPPKPQPKESNVLCFFFSKKKSFLAPLEPAARPTKPSLRQT
jgi:hypothetical protein